MYMVGFVCNLCGSISQSHAELNRNEYGIYYHDLVKGLYIIVFYMQLVINIWEFFLRTTIHRYIHTRADKLYVGLLLT